MRGKTYNSYLFPQTLNEMYYGKNIYFDEIEKSINELKNLIKKASSSTVSTVSSTVSESSEFKDIKKENLILQSIINTANSFSYNYNEICQNIKRKAEELLERNIIPGIMKTKEYIKQHSLFTRYMVLNEEDLEIYVGSIKKIIYYLYKIFRFPKVYIDILDMNKSDNFINICFVISDNLVELYQTKKDKSNIKYENYANQLKLNQFKSDTHSIYFDKFSRDYIHIVLSSNLFIQSSAKELMALLLHEIGRTFGNKLLPENVKYNMKIQENFASAFVTKFGYAKYLIDANEKKNYMLITNVVYYIISKVSKIINYDLNFILEKLHIKNLPQYLNFKLLLVLGLNILGFDANKMSNFLINNNYQEYLQHLVIELQNPRLDSTKKKLLRRDIDMLSKRIGEYPDIDNMIKDINKKEDINANIIKDILDKIYDETMGNM